MELTPELAKRVLARPTTRRSIISPAMSVEILVDWLEGMKYKEIMAKHHISKSVVSRVVDKAKKEAKEMLGTDD